MAYVLTNKTAQTPLGFGALGVSIEPGQSRTVTAAEYAQVENHPVVAGWVDEGKLDVAKAKKQAEPAPAETEVPPVPPVPEVVPPKVPAPTPTAKK